MTKASSVLGLAVLIAAAACGSDSQAPSGTSPYTTLYQGLCQTHVEATHPDAARRTFFDRVHQSLHELAAEAAASDRAAAARLLEAKEAVERDLAGEPSVLRADLDRLLEATRLAIRAIGEPTPEPCKGAP